MARLEIEAIDQIFPSSQRGLVVNRGVKREENWECRHQLAVTQSGEVFWAYNPDPCRVGGYNRDAYIRHLFECHLGVQRARDGKTRVDEISESLLACLERLMTTHADFRQGKRWTAALFRLRGLAG